MGSDARWKRIQKPPVSVWRGWVHASRFAIHDSAEAHFPRGTISGMDAVSEPLINVDPEILGGEPVFMGTRVPIQTLVDHLAAGESLEVFLDDFPTVGREQAIRFIVESATEYAERHGAPAA